MPRSTLDYNCLQQHPCGALTLAHHRFLCWWQVLTRVVSLANNTQEAHKCPLGSAYWHHPSLYINLNKGQPLSRPAAQSSKLFTALKHHRHLIHAIMHDCIGIQYIPEVVMKASIFWGWTDLSLSVKKVSIFCLFFVVYAWSMLIWTR